MGRHRISWKTHLFENPSVIVFPTRRLSLPAIPSFNCHLLIGVIELFLPAIGHRTTAVLSSRRARLDSRVVDPPSCDRLKLDSWRTRDASNRDDQAVCESREYRSALDRAFRRKAIPDRDRDSAGCAEYGLTPCRRAMKDGLTSKFLVCSQPSDCKSRSAMFYAPMQFP